MPGLTIPLHRNAPASVTIIQGIQHAHSLHTSVDWASTWTSQPQDDLCEMAFDGSLHPSAAGHERVAARALEHQREAANHHIHPRLVSNQRCSTPDRFTLHAVPLPCVLVLLPEPGHSKSSMPMTVTSAAHVQERH